MTKKTPITLLTGIPQSQTKQIAQTVKQYAQQQGKQYEVISTWDLLKRAADHYGHHLNPRKILTWDPFARDMALDVAYQQLQSTNHLDRLLLTAHATFPDYKGNCIDDALHQEHIRIIQPQHIINVQYDPVQIFERTRTDSQWSGIDHPRKFMEWQWQEYRHTRSLANAIDTPSPKKMIAIGASIAPRNIRSLYEVIEHPDKPLGYFSYKITGVDDKTLRQVERMMDDLQQSVNIIWHGGIEIERSLAGPYESTINEYLPMFQLDMLMSQIDVHIGAYVKVPTPNGKKLQPPSPGAINEFAESHARMKPSALLILGNDQTSPYLAYRVDTVLNRVNQVQPWLRAIGILK